LRLIVSTMKDEGPFILEWVAHYLALGFDHFIIASNDCSDGTERILQRLQAIGLVTHIDNPGPWDQGPQASAYHRAMAHPKFAEATWVLVCDADEFLDIKCGDHTLDALFAACPEASVFTFIWQLFGHNGVIQFRDQPVTAQFTRCAAPQQIHPMQSRAIKTLFRNNGHYRLISTHRPKSILPRHARQSYWVDGNGARLTGFEQQGWAFLGTGQGYGDALARMNHYAVRSMESYMMKRLRGDVNTTSFHGKMESSGEIYWRLHCWNDVENHNLAQRGGILAAVLARLQSDAVLLQLHQQSVAFHQDRIADLRDRPQFTAFVAKYGDYMGERRHLLKDNVLTDLDQAYDISTFDAAKVLSDFRISRYREMRKRRLVRKWPWFAAMDALETSTDPAVFKHIAQAGTIPGPQADLPKALIQGIADAISAARPQAPATRRFLAQASAPKCRNWLLIGGRDRVLIDAILARDEVATLIVVDPWGFRETQLVSDHIIADPGRLALDHAFFQTIAIYADALKSGRLRIVRSTAASALKLIEDRSLDVVMIAGTKPAGRVMRLMDRATRKLRKGGRLMFNGYRIHSKNGREMIAAIHKFAAASPGNWRFMAVHGPHLALERLPKRSQDDG
jgi:hypothetical protein